MNISGREIGPTEPAYIVAEVSCNHMGSKVLATELIQIARDAGADAVKFQRYEAWDFYVKHGDPLWELYESAKTPAHWLPELKTIAEDMGLGFFVSPFGNIDYVNELEQMGVSAYKIGFSEAFNRPLLEAVRATGKPVMVTLSMATQREVYWIGNSFERGQPLALLAGTSGYPTPHDEVNLGRLIDIVNWAYEFGDIIPGWSEHTTETRFSVQAVALGACIVERHLIKNRAAGGPDAAFSLEGDEFATMVNEIREFESNVGHEPWALMPCEEEWTWRKQRSKER